MSCVRFAGIGGDGGRSVGGVREVDGRMEEVVMCWWGLRRTCWVGLPGVLAVKVRRM